VCSTSTGQHALGSRPRPPVALCAPDRPAAHTPHGILARLDRINVWSMPFMFIGIIGTGFLFAFYDVLDINVSFIQSCIALKHGCTPANAVSTLRIPVVLTWPAMSSARWRSPRSRTGSAGATCCCSPCS
jgi:hypothetical protein